MTPFRPSTMPPSPESSFSLPRREFLRRATSAALLGSASLEGTLGCVSVWERRPHRPNVVLILADDMGYSDLGCFGGEMRTPNLDAVAADGIRFTHFHNAARCCPSRASLLTGLYPHQAGVGDMMRDEGEPGYRGDLSPASVTLAEVLKQVGYGTYACGKWHVSRFFEPEGPRHNWPIQRGFDRFFGTLNGAGSFFEPQTLVLDNDPAEVPGEGFYYTDAIADHAVRFLREHQEATPERPFFLYSAFTAPHWPLHAPEEDVRRAEGRFDAGWDALREARLARMREMGIVDPDWALTERDRRVPAWEEGPDRAWQLRRMEVYAAQVEIMDRAVGRILEEVRRQGSLEDTLVLFLADNGGCAEELNTQGWYDYILRGEEKVGRERTQDGRPVRVGNFSEVMPGPDDTYQSYGVPWANVSNTPFRLYKSSAHAGGVATPLLASWPGVIPSGGGLRRQRGHLPDLMATLVDVAGAEYPASFRGRAITPMEGMSLVPAFRNEEMERGPIFFEHEGSRAVLEGKWKLVARGGRGAWELYDTVTDRTETMDLSGRYPSEVQRLAFLWQEWAARAQVLRSGSGGPT